MGQEQAEQARRFERLARSPLDPATLPDQLLHALARVVPFDAFCWGSVDPASLLPTRATGTTVPCTTSLVWQVQELVARGVVGRDLRAPSRSGRYVLRLAEIVNEGSEQGRAYQRVLGPIGLEHQLRAALVVDGTQWGLLHIERGGLDFSSREVALVDAVVPHLADAFRRWILAEPRVATGRVPVLPGVLVLDQDNEVEAITPEAEQWLQEWGFADLEHPPLTIPAVVGAARAAADGRHDQIVSSARVRLPTGVWLHVHASRLARRDHQPRTAVVFERAGSDQVAPLIARAHQLSHRETQIAVLAGRGLSTGEMAAQLFIAEYTVQDHLKSIFDKVGVRSRRELATQVFEPHLGLEFRPSGSSGPAGRTGRPRPRGGARRR